MAFKVVIGKSARLDAQNVLDWYAGESIAALEKFVNNFFLHIDEIAERPESFGIVRQRPHYRKLKIKRFPYYIIFRIDEKRNRVVIAAVVHTKRNPTVWIKRLR